MCGDGEELRVRGLSGGVVLRLTRAEAADLSTAEVRALCSTRITISAQWLHLVCQGELCDDLELMRERWQPGRPLELQLVADGRRGCQGARVDYWSCSHECWMPAVLTRVLPTGDVEVSVKPGKFLSPAEQDRLLRPCARPSRAQLAWMASVLEDDRVGEEARALISRFVAEVGGQGGGAALPDDAAQRGLRPMWLESIGLEMDGLMGVCGSIAALAALASARTPSVDDLAEALRWQLQQTLAQFGPPPQATSAGRDREAFDIQVQSSYLITVDTRRCGKLGVDATGADGRTLQIGRIKDGLIQNWNNAHLNERVRVGDRIVEVNGVYGHAELLQHECRKRKVLHLRLRRAYDLGGRRSTA